MKVRFLKTFFIFFYLFLGIAPAGFAHAQRPGGPPPGGPPPGGPPPGGPPPNGPGPGGQPPSQGAGRGGNAPRSAVQFGPVGRWWDDKSVVKSIGLRKDQQKQMDAIFDASKPAILAGYKSFLGEQSKLEKLSRDPHADQAQLSAATDAVIQARASLQKATAQMLLEIRKQMEPDQIEKLEKLR